MISGLKNMNIFKVDFKKTILFVIAGGMGALTSLIIYTILLQFLGVWYLYASIISFVLASFAGFCFQRYITFRGNSKNGIRKQVVYYFSLSLLNLVLNVLILSFFVEILVIDKIIAKVLTLGIVAIWSYFIYQKYIFR